MEKREVQTTMPKFSGVTCRGSAVLGTDCGTCEKCRWHRRVGWEAAQPNPTRSLIECIGRAIADADQEDYMEDCVIYDKRAAAAIKAMREHNA